MKQTIKRIVETTNKVNPLITLGIIYFIARLPKLALLPIFNDEAIYLDWGFREIHTDAGLFFSLHDAKQPFLMWIFGIAQNFTSNPLFAGRFISLLLGLLTAAAIYKIAEGYFGKKAAANAFILYTLTPIFVFYDRQALMESAVASSGAWSFYFLIRLLKTNQKKFALLLGISLGLGIFTKSNALIFFFTTIAVSAFFVLKNPSKRISQINQLLLVGVTVLFILMPLYMQETFWQTLSTNKRFGLALSELLGFPLSTWINNFKGILQISFWLLTPVVMIFSTIGFIKVLMEKKSDLTLLTLWIIAGILTVGLTARNISPRYLVPFLPLVPILTVKTLTELSRKQAYYYFFTALCIFPTIFISFKLIYSPISYFNLLDKLTIYSEKSSYVTGWTSGYGIPEAVSYLKEKARGNKLLALVRLDAGNPESAVFAYFNNHKSITPYYFDSKMFSEEIFSYDCISTSVNSYFISRDGILTGLEKFFQEEQRFYKPEGNHFIGIHKFKEDCTGKHLSIF